MGRTVRIRRAAYYECEEWTVHISEEQEGVRVWWKDKPFTMESGVAAMATRLDTDGDWWDWDVLEPLLVILHAARQAALAQDQSPRGME